MTEKSLLLKCDFAGHFFIVGTDFPAARVFDTKTSSLAAVVELPLRSRTVSLAALTLTSVAIRRIEKEKNNKRSAGPTALARHSTERFVDDDVATYYAAMGLSNGSLVLHNVHLDALLAHVQVSATQQPLTSLQLCGDFVFCLAANSMLYMLSLRDIDAGPCMHLRVQSDASAVAVTKVQMNSNAAAVHEVYRVMVAGATNALYEMRTLPHNNSNSTTQQDAPQTLHATRCLAFPSQGTSVEFAWVSDNCVGGDEGSSASLPAVTASAQDGVVRLWDLQYVSAASSPASILNPTTNIDGAAAAAGSGSSTDIPARCRRTLLCGQRILNVSVLPSTQTSRNGLRKDNYIMVTTLTGSVLLWSLGDALLPSVVEPMPLKPDIVLVSAVPSGRLLFGALRVAGQSSSPSSAAAGSSAEALRGLEVMLLRGRFAMPIFETKNIGAAVEASSTSAAASASATANTARRTALATLALGVAGNTAITVAELPLSSTREAALVEREDVDYLLEHTTDVATSSFVLMDTVWAAHQQQVAAKASQSMTEAFKAPQIYRTKSIQDLPVRQLTLEQRLQQIAREGAAAARKRRIIAVKGGEVVEEDGNNVPCSVLSQHALGLATIPLYQALHANDTSAVMDLLDMSSRTEEGMRATVLSLQLPYCLQLLQIISERLGLVSRAVEKAAPISPGEATNGSTAENGQNIPKVDPTDAQSNGRTSTATTGLENSESVNVGESGVLRGGVAAFSIRSSLLEWIDAILNYRGSELLAVQREWNARAARKAAGTSSPEDDVADTVSPPKDFLAPILHHYQDLCLQYDKLAVLYGRLSVFKSVRPSHRNAFTNVPRQSLGSNIEMARPVRASAGGSSATSGVHKRRLYLAEKSSVVDSDIIFPIMFKESRARSGHRVVRVRSKLEIAKKRQERENKDAELQKRARALARQELRERKAKGGHSILDDDNQKGGGVDVMEQIMTDEVNHGDGELDLDLLEAMDLADDVSAMDESDVESVEKDDNGDAELGRSSLSRRGKKTRQEVVDEMIADAGNGENNNGNDEDAEDDADASLDSSEAEFSSASDDEVRSDASDEESESEEEEEEEEEEQDCDDGSQYSSDDGSDANDDDGMGENMRELFTRHEDDEDRTERRKAKKVRTG